ncbi:hypothetical protein NIES2119_18945 [[Phormidium ambiguum] IAM M-71]|uniref:Uncharacterized protein n=1 Tax=[Phormidium ambiguum] IAM M-71 TaxID=454136 RepID=A0A1U7IGD8_9CYAN|nr:hypothetical protein NIES2119_18945 [Phormidium ambiguum IAM M-71]
MLSLTKPSLCFQTIFDGILNVWQKQESRKQNQIIINDFGQSRSDLHVFGQGQAVVPIAAQFPSVFYLLPYISWQVLQKLIILWVNFSKHL